MKFSVGKKILGIRFMDQCGQWEKRFLSLLGLAYLLATCPLFAAVHGDVCAEILLVKDGQAGEMAVPKPLTLAYIRKVAAFNKGFLPTAVRKVLEEVPTAERAALGAPISWYMRINVVKSDAEGLWRVGTSFPTSLRIDRFGGEVFINDPEGILTL
jgi:hypothetical protein